MAEEKNFADMDLKDFIWETEEHRFEPKENRYENILKGKKKEAEEKNKLKEKKLRDDSDISRFKKKKLEELHNANLTEHL